MTKPPMSPIGEAIFGMINAYNLRLAADVQKMTPAERQQRCDREIEQLSRLEGLQGMRCLSPRLAPIEKESGND